MMILSNKPWRPGARRTLGRERTSFITIGKICEKDGRQCPSTSYAIIKLEVLRKGCVGNDKSDFVCLFVTILDLFINVSGNVPSSNLVYSDRSRSKRNVWSITPIGCLTFIFELNFKYISARSEVNEATGFCSKIILTSPFLSLCSDFTTNPRSWGCQWFTRADSNAWWR